MRDILQRLVRDGKQKNDAQRTARHLQHQLGRSARLAVQKGLFFNSQLVALSRQVGGHFAGLVFARGDDVKTGDFQERGINSRTTHEYNSFGEMDSTHQGQGPRAIGRGLRPDVRQMVAALPLYPRSAHRINPQRINTSWYVEIIKNRRFFADSILIRETAKKADKLICGPVQLCVDGLGGFNTHT
jgi:hypothetical protein